MKALVNATADLHLSVQKLINRAHRQQKRTNAEQKTPLEQALDSVQAAKDPTSKQKESGF